MTAIDDFQAAIQAEIQMVEEAIDKLRATRTVPRIDEIGGGASERLFCGLAHQVVRGEFADCPERLQLWQVDCGMLRAGQCGLTGYAQRCLFGEPDDEWWQQIADSEQKRPGTLRWATTYRA